jgi:glycosyltransferase involved in cell wall biosynthesis
MKIAVVRSSSVVLDAAGYNIQEIGLAKGLLKIGVSADIYMAGRERAIRSEVLRECNGSSIRLFLMPFVSLPGKQAIFPGLLRLLDRGMYDVVQVHEDSQITSSIVSCWASRKGIPTVLCQGMYRDYSGVARLAQFLYDSVALPRLRRSVRAGIAKTRAAKEYLASKGFASVYVCPVGLDDEVFEMTNEALCEKDGHHCDRDGSINLTYVGSLEERRNPLFMIDLIDALVRSRKGIRFLVAGDGPQREEFLKRVSEKGLGEHIRYLGRLDQRSVAALLRDTDAFILPSSYEIYGMVTLEAMYFGVPVFSTATAGATDIIENGLNGFIIKDLDVEKWRGIIEAYIDDKDRRRIGQNASQTVRDKFVWDKACLAFYQVYRRVTAGTRA